MVTEVVKTIRSSGGDYTSTTAWEAALPADLVALDEQHTGVLYNDWPSGLTDTLTIGGQTTDATRYVHLTVAAGHRHGGIHKSAFYWQRTSSYGVAILNYTAYTRISYIDCEVATTSANFVRNEGANALIDSCLGVLNSVNSDTLCYFPNGGSAPTHVRNSAFYKISGPATSRAIWWRNYTPGTCENTLAAGFTYGFSCDSGSVTYKNSVSYNNSTGYSGGGGSGSTNNASSAASGAPGANPVYNVASTDFADAANHDYHLSSTSVLHGAGVNLYSTFTTDIDGDTWPATGAWDIGIDHYMAGAGTTISISDSGSGADALGSIAVSLSMADSGVGVDAMPGTAAALQLADSGAGADAITLAALLAVSDAGAGADAISLAIALQVADAGSGADLVNVLTATLIQILDTGSGADAIGAVSVALGLADAGAGTEATLIQAALQLADAGSGVDALSVLTATLIQILDAGAGADALSVAVAVPVSDAGLGTDLLAIQAIVQLVESATGADAVVRFDSAARIYSITFTLAQRRAEFSLRQRSAVFTLN